ncbi:MAG: hypothetical protein HP058_03100, partial [Massilimaliae sp.]|nr:hypothetical protein [Massiliimalia sp.]
IIDDDRRFNAQKFEEQFYNAKGLRDVEEGKTAPMPKFEAVTELLDPMAKVIDEQDETKTEQPETKDDNMEMLAKLLANPETASLLKAFIWDILQIWTLSRNPTGNRTSFARRKRLD